MSLYEYVYAQDCGHGFCMRMFSSICMYMCLPGCLPGLTVKQTMRSMRCSSGTTHTTAIMSEHDTRTHLAITDAFQKDEFANIQTDTSRCTYAHTSTRTHVCVRSPRTHVMSENYKTASCLHTHMPTHVYTRIGIHMLESLPTGLLARGLTYLLASSC